MGVFLPLASPEPISLTSKTQSRPYYLDLKPASEENSSLYEVGKKKLSKVYTELSTLYNSNRFYPSLEILSFIDINHYEHIDMRILNVCIAVVQTIASYD